MVWWLIAEDSWWNYVLFWVKIADAWVKIADAWVKITVADLTIICFVCSYEGVRYRVSAGWKYSMIFSYGFLFIFQCFYLILTCVFGFKKLSVWLSSIWALSMVDFVTVTVASLCIATFCAFRGHMIGGKSTKFQVSKKMIRKNKM